MTNSPAKFNAELYKETTLKQWNSAAQAWDRWGNLLSRWLGPGTETLLDQCHVSNGSRVLDVAAGAGEQSIATAKRVGKNGYVLATDLSPDILNFAAMNAKREGFDHIETLVIDGEHLDKINQEPFDAVISRVGLIYFPDQHKALIGMKNQLREGGKIGAMVYSTAEMNPFFSIPVSIIRRRANLPAPLAGQPGPFSLGNPAVLKKTLETAGFKSVEVTPINAPIRLSSAAECLQFEQESFGALHQMMSSMSDLEKDDTWNEIEKELEQFEDHQQFTGPCEMLIAVGTK